MIVTSSHVENQDAIINILSEVTEDSEATVDICAEAAVLLAMLKKHHFFEIGEFLQKFSAS